MDTFYLIAVIVLTVINLVIYHKVFQVLYFDLGKGLLKEIVVSVFLAIIELSVILWVFKGIASVVGGIFAFFVTVLKILLVIALITLFAWVSSKRITNMILKHRKKKNKMDLDENGNPTEEEKKKISKISKICFILSFILTLICIWLTGWVESEPEANTKNGAQNPIENVDELGESSGNELETDRFPYYQEYIFKDNEKEVALKVDFWNNNSGYVTIELNTCFENGAEKKETFNDTFKLNDDNWFYDIINEKGDTTGYAFEVRHEVDENGEEFEYINLMDMESGDYIGLSEKEYAYKHEINLEEAEQDNETEESNMELREYTFFCSEGEILVSVDFLNNKMAVTVNGFEDDDYYKGIFYTEPYSEYLFRRSDDGTRYEVLDLEGNPTNMNFMIGYREGENYEYMSLIDWQTGEQIGLVEKDYAYNNLG